MPNNDWESNVEWLRLVGDLRAFREEQIRAFAGVDDLLVARFVAGECSADETRTVEAAMAAQPAVKELVEVLQEVAALDGFPNLAVEPTTSVSLAEALQRTLAFATDLQSSAPGGGGWLELDGPLISALDRAAHASPSDRLNLTEQALFQSERLFAVMAGEEDREPVLASLPWYTDLTDWPTRLDWDTVPDISTWTVRVICRAASLKWSYPLSAPHLEFPPEVASQTPRGKDVLWEIHANDAAGKSLNECHVRGVFRVLPEDQVAELNAELASTAKIDDEDRRNFVEFGYLVERKCYAAAITRLEELTVDRGNLHLRLLRWRGLSSIYLRMHRELTGQRRMGVPEGLWALQLSRENLRAAYELLNLSFPEK